MVGIGDMKIDVVLEVVQVEKVDGEKGFVWRATLAPDRPGRPGVQCGIVMDAPMPAGAKYRVSIVPVFE